MSKHDPNRPHIPGVVSRFAAYYRQPENGSWGSLHVVLDDYNVADGFVDFCIEDATRRGDEEGAALGRILRQMSPSQRYRMHAAVVAFIAANSPPAPSPHVPVRRAPSAHMRSFPFFVGTAWAELPESHAPVYWR